MAYQFLIKISKRWFTFDFLLQQKTFQPFNHLLHVHRLVQGHHATSWKQMLSFFLFVSLFVCVSFWMSACFSFFSLFLFLTLKAITFYLTLSFSLFVYWKQKLFSSLFLFLTLKHKLSILSACLSVHPFCSSLFFSSSNHTAMLGSKPLQYKMGLQVLFLSRLCFFLLLRRSSKDRALHPIK